MDIGTGLAKQPAIRYYGGAGQRTNCNHRHNISAQYARSAYDRSSAAKSMLPTFALIAVMFILMYFMMVRGPRKKQQEQRKMVQSLKKNDRVQTIGGMLGTILDVKDDEVSSRLMKGIILKYGL